MSLASGQRFRHDFCCPKRALDLPPILELNREVPCQLLFAPTDPPVCCAEPAYCGILALIRLGTFLAGYINSARLGRQIAGNPENDRPPQLASAVADQLQTKLLHECAAIEANEARRVRTVRRKRSDNQQPGGEHRR